MFLDIYRPKSPVTDPNSDIVKLVERITGLVHGEAAEITGATATKESYLLFKMSTGRYCITRNYKGKTREYSFFPDDWLTNQKDGRALKLTPDLLLIQGNPYKITIGVNEQSERSLKVETWRDG